jgi:hypothetical protein
LIHPGGQGFYLVTTPERVDLSIGKKHFTVDMERSDGSRALLQGRQQDQVAESPAQQVAWQG